jgi:hypothetical protein
MGNNKPFFKCPRFNSCSVNNCPLDSAYPYLYTDSNDPQQKCTLGKIYRLRIAEEYPYILKMNGMTKREFSGKKAWDQMSEEKKEEIIKNGKKSLKALCSQNNL